MFNFWNCRPSAFSQAGDDSCYDRMGRRLLLKLYENDNQQATSTSNRSSARPCTGQRHEGTKLRTCQWNINYFYHAQRHMCCDARQAADYIVNKLLETDADVIILNELGLHGGQSWREALQLAGDGSLDGITKAVKIVTDRLGEAGYITQIANSDCPTAVATRLPLVKSKTLELDATRGAVAVQVRLDDHDHAGDGEKKSKVAWIYGTHLEDQESNGGSDRKKEMEELLEQMKIHDNSDLNQRQTNAHDTADGIGNITLVLGDFNQQRQVDYTESEWNAICANKKFRGGSPEDDGVAGLLRNAGFSSIWDKQFAHEATCNWRNQDHPPPSTHWTGTIVDYAYGRGQGLKPTQILVSSSSLSDHRMIVVDWTW